MRSLTIEEMIAFATFSYENVKTSQVASNSIVTAFFRAAVSLSP
ncbi:MAG TPA: hypothetical protein VLN46_06705 [Gillisia sp.]|nr:hypothetical protein [Gillisia sp.]